MFKEFPRIVECIENFQDTEASLTYQKIFQLIVLIVRHPGSFDKTFIRFFDDKNFEFK